jgi:LCP family protein required for cell wall assembly
MMKKLFNKFKKTNLSQRLVYIFIGLLFLVSYVNIFISLCLLHNIETGIRIIALVVLGILLCGYLFFGLILLLVKKKKTLYVASFIVVVISALCMVGSATINKVYGSISNINSANKKILYTTNLITLNDTEFKNEKETIVGMINNESDPEGYKLPKELIEKEKLVVTIKEYETYFEMLEDLYNKKIQGLFITSNYGITYSTYETYSNIEQEVKVVKKLSKEMENQEIIESKGTAVTEPFTILIMGVDSESDKLNANAAFNGDTLMLITFNPHTLNATVFSIPRDTYVPIACLRGDSSKINSSAAYGTKCVIDTIENLVDIKIDYYVKVDFKGVVDMVDALGGIDITVPDGIDFCEQDSHRNFAPEALQCIKSGYQHMNGEKALAFARHRHTLLTGDFARVQHQQLVVEAMVNKVKSLKSIDDFYKVLDAASNNLITNMSTQQILNLYNVAKNALGKTSTDSMITIQKTYLTGYGLNMYVNNLRLRVYTFQYYPQSLAEIKTALKENLEIIKPKMIKTFAYSINDNYKVPTIGEKYYTVEKNETIPNFEWQSIDYAKSWCEARELKYSIIYVKSSEYKVPKKVTVEDGMVAQQSAPYGKLVKDVTDITFRVIRDNEVETTTTTSTTRTTVSTSEASSSSSSQTTESTTTTTTTTELDPNPIDD